MIPWERYSGEAIEELCSAFICRLHPRATRIRPSRGDGGIDVVERNDDGSLTVYQIKRFATKLDSSRREQIKRSWSRLRETIDEDRLSEWHLVLPLDATREDIKWFEDLVKDTNVRPVWDGLSRVDGWAADMPDLVDYFLSDQHEQTMERVRLELQSIGLPGPAEDVLAIGGRLNALAGILSEQDPYYSYSITLLSDDDPCDWASVSRPGLVASILIDCNDCGVYRVDVFARYASTVDFAPLRGSVTLRPENEEQRQQVQNYLDYGIPFDEVPGYLWDLEGPSVFGALSEGSDGVVSVKSSTSIPINGEPILMVSEGGVELELRRVERSSGAVGARVLLADDSGMMSVDVRFHADGSGTGTVHFDYSSGEGKNPGAVATCLRIQKATHSHETVSLMCNSSVLFEFNTPLGSIDDETLDAIIGLADALCVIGKKARREIPFPDVAEVARDDWASALRVARLLATRTEIHHVECLDLVIDSCEHIQVSLPAVIRWIRPLSLSFVGAEYDLGLVDNYYPVERIESCGEGQYRFYAPEGVERAVTVIPDNLPEAARLKGMFLVGRYVESDWQAWLNGASDN